MTTKAKQLNVLLFLPGTLFWALLVAGLVAKNDTLVVVAVVIAICTVIMFITMKVRAAGAAKLERNRLLEHGVRGVATVVTIGTRGGGVNDHPMIDFELDVRVGDGPPRRTQVRALISQLAIPRIQPGCEIAVHVDPADHDKVLVDASLTPYGYK